MRSKVEAEPGADSQIAYEMFAHVFSVFAGVAIMLAPRERDYCLAGIALCAVVMSLYAFAALTGEDKSSRWNLSGCGIWLANVLLQGLNLYLIGIQS